MGSYPGFKFGTYSWATLCARATMAKFLKYKFDDNTAMSEAITQFTVHNFSSNPMSNLKFDLENLRSLPDQVKFLPGDLTQVKSNQNSTYDMVRKLKDRGS